MREMRENPVRKLRQRAAPSAGLTEDAAALVHFVVEAHKAAQDILGKEAPMEYTQWLLLSYMIKNEARGEHTTVKDVHELVKKLREKTALNTVRTRFEKLEREDYIMQVRKVARTLLYRPTPNLFSRLNVWSTRLGGLRKHHR